MVQHATPQRVSSHVSLLWSRLDPGGSLALSLTQDRSLHGRARPESAQMAATSRLVEAQCGDISPRYQTRGERKQVRQQKLARPAKVLSKRCDEEGYWEQEPTGLQQFVYSV